MGSDTENQEAHSVRSRLSVSLARFPAWIPRYSAIAKFLLENRSAPNLIQIRLRDQFCM